MGGHLGKHIGVVSNFCLESWAKQCMTGVSDMESALQCRHQQASVFKAKMTKIGLLGHLQLEVAKSAYCTWLFELPLTVELCAGAAFRAALWICGCGWQIIYMGCWLWKQFGIDGL